MPESINDEQKFWLSIVLGRHLCLLGLVTNYAGRLEDVAVSVLILFLPNFTFYNFLLLSSES